MNTKPDDYHALLSPSGAHRWTVCFRSPLMEKGLPDAGDPVYRDEGTCAHSVAAACLTEGKPASAYIGRRFDVDPHRTFEFTEGMAEPVQTYIDAIITYATGNEMLVEVDVPIDSITGEEGATGRSDVIIFTADGEEVQVHDLKFGMGVRVDAESNPQGMLYALGALAKYDVINEVKRARIVIHQPRMNHLSEWVVSVEELRAFGEQVAGVASLALDVYRGGVYEGEMFGLVPGEKQCKFCKAKATCPALTTHVAEVLGADFEKIEALDIKTPDGLVPNDPVTLAQKFKAIDLIEQFVKAVRAKAEAYMFEHQNSDEAQRTLGLKVVAGKKGSRVWINDKEVEAAFKSFRLKKEEMYSMKLITPPAAEKLLKGEPKRWEKIQALITQPEGQPTVVPLDDKRPALVMKPASDDFDAVDDLEGLA